MKQKKNILLVVFFITSISFSQTSIPPGNVSGTWLLSGSPYLVNGDITIISGSTLTIEPGVIVAFQGNYKLTVNGRLMAIGTMNDTIVFTAVDTSVGWHGIRFSYIDTNGMDSSKLIYCRLSSGKSVGPTSADMRGGAVYAEGSSKILFSSCMFSNNYAANDGGAVCLLSGSNPNIENCTFKNNMCGFFGGALYIDASNPKIRNCIMSNGYSSIFGAGMCLWNSSAPRIENCRIINNTAGAVCGIYATANSSPVIINCLFSGNISNLGNGGAMGFSVANATVINCTLVNNLVAQGGAGIWIYNSTAVIQNCIIWNNIPDAVSATGSTVTVNYSDITGGMTGIGNFSLNPLFVNSGDDPFAIQESSPCRNTGTPDTTGLGLPLIDLAGQPRISENRVDVGAYEFYVPIPVELYSFTSSIRGNSVTLNWSTATEKNNYGFEVERNAGNSWDRIGFVHGNITSTTPSHYFYNDNNLAVGMYSYRLRQIDLDGSFRYYLLPNNVEIIKPLSFELYQNYPNPFNPSTTIRYALPVECSVNIIVTNSLGECVREFSSGLMSAGLHEITFMLDNCSSGIYYYTINAVSDKGSREFRDLKKMIVLK